MKTKYRVIFKLTPGGIKQTLYRRILFFWLAISGYRPHCLGFLFRETMERWERYYKHIEVIDKTNGEYTRLLSKEIKLLCRPPQDRIYIGPSQNISYA